MAKHEIHEHHEEPHTTTSKPPNIITKPPHITKWAFMRSPPTIRRSLTAIICMRRSVMMTRQLARLSVVKIEGRHPLG